MYDHILIATDGSDLADGAVSHGLELAKQGVDPVAAIGGEAGWPLTWYWRRTPVWWADAKAGQRPPLVFCCSRACVS